MKINIKQLFVIAAILTVSLASVGRRQPVHSTAVPLHVNAGSPSSYTAKDGRVFLAEQLWAEGGWGFIGGRSLAFNGFDLYATGGTDIKPVYATQRILWSEFRVSDIPNDTYMVTLYFREWLAHGPESNVFTILAEDAVAIEALDIYAEVGRDYALVRQFVVPVADNELNLVIEQIKKSPNVSAISIQPISDNGQAPAIPKELIGQDSYKATQIAWKNVSASDLDGYYIYRSESGAPFSRLNQEPLHLNRYRDQTAEEGKTYQYQISAVDVFGNESGRSDTIGAKVIPLSEATLPVFDLTIDPLDWHLINDAPYVEETIDGSLSYDGQQYDVSVRYRGGGTRLANKKNWKLKFGSNSPFRARDTVNLNGDNLDFTYLRGPLSFQHLTDIGIDAPEHSFALLVVNNQFMGVFNDYEQIDENFMERTGRDIDTSIFKLNHNLFKDLNSEAEYESAYEKNNNRSTGHTDLIEFMETLANASDDEFPWLLQKRFDIASYLKQYAYIVSVGNVDAFDRNAYLLHDENTEKWEMIPWDYDYAYGTISADLQFNNPSGIDLGMEQDRILPQRGVNVPQYRHYFCTHLKRYQTHILQPTNVFNNVAIFQQQILDDVQRDWLKIGWENSYQHDDLPALFRKYVSDSQAIQNGQIADYCDPYDRPYVEINEVSPTTTEAYCDPADLGTDGCDDGWIEIYNKGLLPLNLNGYHFSNNELNPKMHRISGELIVPPLSRVMVWADGQTDQGVNHLAFELSSDNDFLILSDPSGKMIDSVAWDSLPLGHSIARIPDGADRIETLSGPTPNKENKKEAPEISSLSLFPTAPTAEDWVTFRANIADEGLFDATLYYQVNGTGFVAYPLTESIPGTWSGTLQPAASQSRVQYYIEAEDLDGSVSTWPPGAPHATSEYIVDYLPPTLFINELMASNSTLFIDPSSPEEAPDYIEIFNPGPWPVNLEGMFMSDDLAEPQKHQLTADDASLIIRVGEFKLLLADSNVSSGSNHLGFKLSRDGEDIILSDRSDFGRPVIDSYTFDEQEKEVAIGRCWNGGDWQTLAAPSPGLTNSGCGKEPPVLTEFSQTPRWPIRNKDSEVVIEITATDNVQVQQTDLKYRAESGAWITVPMVKSGDRYSYALPAGFDIGTIVEFYIEAKDINGFTTRYPAGAPDRLQRFMVHFDQVGINNDFSPPPQLIFNEIVAVGTKRGITEENEPNERSAWVEIYNGEGEAINLGGYRLAHDLFFPHDYTIPNGVTIEANGYLTFLLDDDPEQGALHAAFEPIPDGDTIRLYNRSNILIDEITYGAELASGLALARINDGQTISFELTVCASPGVENSTDCLRDTFLPFVAR